MNIKELLLSCGSFKIRDETQIRFWENTWVGNNPFKHQFPTIFNITHDPCNTKKYQKDALELIKI
jgi:hypothetical protein